MKMAYQESGEVLMRGRKVENSTEKPLEKSGTLTGAPAGNSNFTAHNAEFDRRRVELRKLMARNRAAAESELARLSKRCDVLKEFLIDSDNAAGELENLGSIINAEKEFSGRLEQLELRYYKLCGKVFENPGIGAHSSTAAQESEVAPRRQGGSFKECLPLLIGMIVSALIIALTLMLLFL